MAKVAASTSPLASLDCFKAYDLRGRVPEQLDTALARRLGRCLADFLGARHVVVGHDVRLSSVPLCRALSDGLTEAGCEVSLLGLCGTEEVYWAVADLGLDGGVMITASHNPAEDNGMKIVGADARPISADTGLGELRERLAEGRIPAPAPTPGATAPLDHRQSYLDCLLGAVDIDALRAYKIVVNAGNGGAGAIIDRLAPSLPFQFVRLRHEADGRFPHGVPNPMLPELRGDTAQAVRDSGADFGLAWDGDFDRCFFFDERGEFIESYYLVGVLAEAFLRRAEQPGSVVVYDPRLLWNTLEVVAAHGGRAVQSRAGHAFIKEVMRREDAVYGGEMSAHHYFRDFAYCDSGMLPWLLVAELLSRSGQPLSALVADRVRRFPVSGEINRSLDDVAGALRRVREHYAEQAERPEIDTADGLSMSFAQWRFNLRGSNTEPMVRLNVESRGEPELMRVKTAEVLALIDALG